MLKFFRRIRRKLLNEGRLRKYVVYATGEILLVVIGILIALQLNNWNEIRKTRTEEQIILQNLQNDFQDNLSQLQQKINGTKRSQYAIEKVALTFINKELESQDYGGLDSLLHLILAVTTFDPKTSSLNEMFSMGKLGVIQNQELRNLLSSWSSDLQDLKQIETRVFNISLLYPTKKLAG